MKHFARLIAVPLLFTLPVVATAQGETDRKNYYFDRTLVEKVVLEKEKALNANLTKMLIAGLRQEVCKPCLMKVSISVTLTSTTAWQKPKRAATIAEIRNEIIREYAREMGLRPCGACRFEEPYTKNLFFPDASLLDSLLICDLTAYRPEGVPVESART